MIGNLIFSIAQYHHEIYGILSSTSTLLFIAFYIQILQFKCQATSQADLAKARQLMGAGKLHDALEIFHRIAGTAQNDASVFFSRATCYLAMNNPNMALKDFDTVLRLSPNSIQALRKRAEIYVKIGDFDKAHIDYERILQQSPRDEDANSALVMIEELKEDYQHVDTLFHEGHHNCHTILGIVRSTLDKSSPDCVKLHEIKGECLAHLGYHKDAVTEYITISNLLPSDTKYIYKASDTLFQMGKLDEALIEIRKCLISDPDSKLCFPLYRTLKKLSSFLVKADQHFEAGEYKECTKSLSKLRNALASKESHILQNMESQIMQKECLCMAKDNNPEALDKCSKCIQLNPNDIETLLVRAQLYLDSDDVEKAKSDYEKVKQIDPHEPRADEGLNKIKNAHKRSKLKDYYKILGVSKSATKKEIDRAYRKKARKYHPDHTKGDPKKAEKDFQEIAEAKDVLTDPEKRKLYDSGVDPNKPEQSQFHHGGGGMPFFFQQGGEFYTTEGFQFPFQGQGFQFRFDFG